MNWLEQHLREFIIPSIKLLKKVEEDESNFRLRLQCSSIEYKPEDLKPFEGKLNPVRGIKHREEGMLEAYLTSIGLAKYHFHNNSSHSLRLLGAQAYYPELTVAHSFVKNSIKDLKNRLPYRNKVLFLGRDVWLWYVLGQKMGLRCVYSPVVSRYVSSNKIAMKKILEKLEIKNGDILFDTGFAGTIHRNATEAVPEVMLENLMLSTDKKDFQQFRNNGLSRNRALFIEYSPKYFRTGTLENKSEYFRDEPTGETIQYYQGIGEFLAAARLTIRFWHCESPKWIAGPRHIRRKSLEESSLPLYLFW